MFYTRNRGSHNITDPSSDQQMMNSSSPPVCTVSFSSTLTKSPERGRCPVLNNNNHNEQLRSSSTVPMINLNWSDLGYQVEITKFSLNSNSYTGLCRKKERKEILKPQSGSVSSGQLVGEYNLKSDVPLEQQLY